MRQRQNWHQDDDTALCGAWVRVSQNRVIEAAGESSSDFWDSVYRDYCSQGRPPRSRTALHSRWSCIQVIVGKFLREIRQATRNAPSDSSPEDVVVSATASYFMQYGRSFELMHCWSVLKSCPEFTARERSSIKRAYSSQETLEDSSDDESDDEDEGQTRVQTAARENELRNMKREVLDRIARAIEDRNKLRVCRLRLKFGSPDEREVVLNELRGMLN